MSATTSAPNDTQVDDADLHSLSGDTVVCSLADNAELDPVASDTGSDIEEGDPVLDRQSNNTIFIPDLGTYIEYIRKPAEDVRYTLLLTLDRSWLCPRCPVILESSAKATELLELDELFIMQDFGYWVFRNLAEFVRTFADEREKLRSGIISECYPDVLNTVDNAVGYFRNPPWTFNCLKEGCTFSREEIDRNSTKFVDYPYLPGNVNEGDELLMLVTKMGVPCPKCCLSASEYEKLSTKNLTTDPEYPDREYKSRYSDRYPCWQKGTKVYACLLRLNQGRSCLNQIGSSGGKCGYEYGKGFVFGGKRDEHGRGTDLTFMPKPDGLNGLEKFWVRKDLRHSRTEEPQSENSESDKLAPDESS